jgi:hypothetical protein
MQAVLLLTLTSLFAHAPQDDPIAQTTWVAARELLVEGRGWTDCAAPFDRLPARAKELVPASVWELCHDSAGIAVRFVTDSPSIDVRWTLTGAQLAMPHMPATGVSGIDCYARDEAGVWRYVNNGRPTGLENQASFGLSAGGEYLLYLPLYNGVRSLEVGVPADKSISAPPPSYRSNTLPVVFYGTSITQGACASRPGMAATAIVGRQLDVPIINLGFSGSGEMEPEMAELISELEASVFVLDCLWNMSLEQLEARVLPFVERLRRAHPSTPIVLAEDSSVADTSPTEKGLVLRRLFDELQCRGLTGLILLPASGMLGDDGDGTVDRVHPNDLGMQRQGQVFVQCLRRVLVPARPSGPVAHSIGRLPDGPSGPHLGLAGKPWNFHLCRTCGSTDGGCYPKESIDAIRTSSAPDCRHRWDLVRREEYLAHIAESFAEVEIRYRVP